MFQTLFGRLKLIALHFPFDAHQKIEMHAFRFEPSFQRLARFRAKLHKHFPFKHVDQQAFGASGPARLHALREGFRSLPREASERMLRKVTWHSDSRKNIEFKYSTKTPGPFPREMPGNIPARFSSLPS